MDLCSKSFSTCVMMLTLLGAARYASSDKLNCTCPGIPPKNLTEPPEKTCFHIHDTFRYSCVRGYVRKAGTSNRIKCKQTDGVAEWTALTLKCIPDPKKTNTEPTYRVTEGPTDIPLDSTITTITTTATAAAAASTGLQMTQSRGSSVSVTAETDSTEPTSPGLQVLSDHSQATGRTTSASTTPKPPDNMTNNPHMSDKMELSSTNTAMIALASLVFISALIGISCFYHRRRSKRNITEPSSPEEQIPMNDQSLPVP